MVHPIWYVVTLGVAIGTVLFAYYNSETPQRQPHTTNRSRNFSYPDYPSDGADSQRSTCSICLNTLPSTHLSRLRCGHSFHKRCIDKWFESSCHLANTCPNCREHV